jgi:hypothetical protein
MLESALSSLNARTTNVNNNKIILGVRKHVCDNVVLNDKMAMIADIVSTKKIQGVYYETVVASVHKNYSLTSMDKNIALFELIYSWLMELQ